jgi:hypothetical protein
MIECNVDIVRCTNTEITILLPNYAWDAWAALAVKLAEKRMRQVYVKIGYPRKPRTTGNKSQSHHFNGHVAQIAAHTGNSFDDEKMWLKREAISMGYPFHTTSHGDVVPESEANASTVECGYLIDTAHRIASDLGITLKET